MKRFFATLTAALLAVTCIPTAFAAETTEEQTGAETLPSKFTTVSTMPIPNNLLLLYPYHLSPTTTNKYVLTDKNDNVRTTYSLVDSYHYPKSIAINASHTYEPLFGCGSSLSGGGTFQYKNTAGRYDVLRIKISDFVSAFNSDGSMDKYVNALGDNFNFKFTDQPQANGDKLYSSLFFESGAAVTSATPDKNGEVEILVSRNPAHGVSYSTDFSYYIVSKGGLSSGGGGGTNRGAVRGLRMGDVTLNGYDNIDDVTTMQRNLCDLEKLNALQVRNGDFDKDKAITIKDVTILQRYLAEFDISEYYR